MTVQYPQLFEPVRQVPRLFVVHSRQEIGGGDGSAGGAGKVGGVGGCAGGAGGDGDTEEHSEASHTQRSMLEVHAWSW